MFVIDRLLRHVDSGNGNNGEGEEITERTPLLGGGGPSLSAPYTPENPGFVQFRPYVEPSSGRICACSCILCVLITLIVMLIIWFLIHKFEPSWINHHHSH